MNDVSQFWEKAIAPIGSFAFEINDSLAKQGSRTCANVGRITTTFPDGSYTTTELGRVVSMWAYWEPERSMANFTPAL